MGALTRTYWCWMLSLLPLLAQAQQDTGRPVTLDPVTITPERYDIRWVGSGPRPRGKSHLGPRWKQAWRLEPQGRGTAIRAIRIYRLGDGHPDAPLRAYLHAGQPDDSIPGPLIWQSDTLWPARTIGWAEVPVPLVHWAVAERGVWVAFQQLGTQRRWEYTLDTRDSLGRPMTTYSQGSVIGTSKPDRLRPQAMWTAHRWVPRTRRQWSAVPMLQVEVIRPRRVPRP